MKIAIPDSALSLLLLQRTDYLVLPRHSFLSRVVARLSRQSTLMAAVSHESRLRKRAVKRRFDTDMQGEYSRIGEWLPAKASAILDIGCGLGGIDVLLFDHYGRDQDLRFYLVDRTQVDGLITYGFGPSTPFYNSLDLTRQVLVGNGLPAESLHLLDAADDARLDIPEPVDLIISLISWGFHYPVSTYIDEAHRLLRPSGRLILDIRGGTEGLAQVEARFTDVQVISDQGKRLTVAATR
jgi:SAM-dependent methyltransferase